MWISIKDCETLYWFIVTIPASEWEQSLVKRSGDGWCVPKSISKRLTVILSISHTKMHSSCSNNDDQGNHFCWCKDTLDFCSPFYIRAINPSQKTYNEKDSYNSNQIKTSKYILIWGQILNVVFSWSQHVWSKSK